MSDQPLPSFDPERLKRERHDADLGPSEETGYDHVGQGAGDDAPSGNAANNPTSGATPPAR